MGKINVNKVRLAFCLSMILIFTNIQNSSAQTMCTKPGTEQFTGVQDGYRYELWNQNGQGTACMTLGEGALFSGEWSDVENYLARRGLGYDKTKEHQELGTFYAVYDCKYNPSSASGNSYLAIYGWTVDPLIEFYIIEDWRNWIPSMSGTATKKGTINVNGSIYDIIENTRVNQPSIVGNTTFQQYFSIRRNKQNNGTINISEHFDAWEALGLDMGKMYEVSFVVEGYQSSGNFDFSSLEIIANDETASAVKDLKGNNDVKIHTNPNNNTLTVDFSDTALNARMKIYNVSGKLVYLQDSIKTNQLVIDNLNSGMYFLSVLGKQITYSTKFLMY